jgi:hypothetical protein
MQIAAMGFLFIAQALQAFQTVVDEHLLHDVSATASEVCAFEGFWGLHLQVFIAMPLANILPETAGEGLFEHTIDSFQMVFGSWKLVAISDRRRADQNGKSGTGCHRRKLSQTVKDEQLLSESER